ncbi:MAG: bifunctional folylpolyglutamate synthase/dihydrofolate synthase, partial [Clostridia bacterium]|nr:bifunctional folylpolyglutamate synthase/dihydrofolate synthase [Clostridia bacterium]
MNYNDALNYIGSRLRFGIKPGLDRTRRLLCRLGEPQKKLRFVHVAGTNGKGSTCTYIASALTCAGKKTGLYTSPYICDFRERMQIDGHMIEKERLAEITQRVSQFVDEDDPLTEFELITCIAMVWFAECGCDVVVLEVGLGGRLDSTNVIDAPLCSVITRIDLDHTAVLGDTISAVAGEKAGIIKPCAPVVIAPNQPEDALSVICARARECGCEAIRPAADKVIPIAASLDGTSIMY